MRESSSGVGGVFEAANDGAGRAVRTERVEATKKDRRDVAQRDVDDASLGVVMGNGDVNAVVIAMLEIESAAITAVRR